MVLHRFASGIAFRTLRVLGIAVAYALVMVTGTAVFMAALGSMDSGREASVIAQQPAATESALQAPEAFLLASRTTSNDKRGF